MMRDRARNGSAEKALADHFVERRDVAQRRAMGSADFTAAQNRRNLAVMGSPTVRTTTESESHHVCCAALS